MRSKSRRVWTPAETERDYVQNAIRAAPPPTRAVLWAFARWLEDARGVALGTVVGRIQSAREFLKSSSMRGRISGARALRRLTAKHVEDFFVKYGSSKGFVARRSMQSAMRLLFKFAASRGWVDESLAAAVPSLRRYRLAEIPRALPEKELHQLLEATRTKIESPRDRAIVWLLACYGVRRGQISALRFEDLDWRGRTILFRAHKRGKPIQHPLVPIVAKTLVEYLRTERPTIPDEEFVFVRKRRPHGRMSPQAVSHTLLVCMRAAEITPRGPQTLRHSFASRLLRDGGTLKTIADLLGHRSFGAVAIYAKVDRPRLLEAAMEWPEVHP